jgi:hypothetical protein
VTEHQTSSPATVWSAFFDAITTTGLMHSVNTLYSHSVMRSSSATFGQPSIAFVR